MSADPTPLIQPADPRVTGLIAWLDFARSAKDAHLVCPEVLQSAAWAASFYGLPAPKMKEAE